MKFFAHSKKNLALTLICLCALSTFAFFGWGSMVAHAQNTGPVVTVLPKYPGPYQNVTVKVEDFSRDINGVNISWSINGKAEKSGVGLKEFTFQTGALGSVSNVSINMGGSVETVSVRPTSVDLIWQSDTYTPPFYAGKALHSNQDPVTVVAEPFFLNSKKERLDPNKLVYKWLQDGNIVGSASGYGKKTFTVEQSILLKPISIEVEVSSTDGTYRSNARITISDIRPEVLVYENHPLYGIVFEKALNGKDFVMAGSETKITAVPFFFSNKQKNSGDLLYDWNLNNSSVSEKGNEVVFRKPENVKQGSSLISLNVKNLERFMQYADASFNIKFSNDSETRSQNVF